MCRPTLGDLLRARVTCRAPDNNVVFCTHTSASHRHKHPLSVPPRHNSHSPTRHRTACSVKNEVRFRATGRKVRSCRISRAPRCFFFFLVDNSMGGSDNGAHLVATARLMIDGRLPPKAIKKKKCIFGALYRVSHLLPSPSVGRSVRMLLPFRSLSELIVFPERLVANGVWRITRVCRVGGDGRFSHTFFFMRTTSLPLPHLSTTPAIRKPDNENRFISITSHYVFYCCYFSRTRCTLFLHYSQLLGKYFAFASDVRIETASRYSWIQLKNASVVHTHALEIQTQPPLFVVMFFIMIIFFLRITRARRACMCVCVCTCIQYTYCIYS